MLIVKPKSISKQLYGHQKHKRYLLKNKNRNNIMLEKTCILTIAIAFSISAFAREEIRIVGSSTVYPFAIKVADDFGRNSGFKSPVLESTGSGGGLKLFCAGIGEQHPDITNASRAIKDKEIKLCANNDITDILEVKIGYDGIVLANSLISADIALSRKQIFEALAAKLPDEKGKLVPNPNIKWSDIDPNFPEQKIEVLGPPPSSGTRDAFVELVMEEACDAFEAIAALKSEDKEAHKVACTTIRSDGAYIDAGEDDNLIVTKLNANDAAIGIFGFSFLDQNPDKIKGLKIDGTLPEFDAIADGSYPVSRPLFFYVKTAHKDIIPGLQDYVALFVNEKAIGEDGYLIDEGLIPLPEDELEQARADVQNFAGNIQ